MSKEQTSKQQDTRSKRDIYVVLSGATPLHAVYTERQAKRFVEQFGHPTEDCRLFLGFLKYHKVKLIPPRKFKAKQVEKIKEALKNVSTKTG